METCTVEAGLFKKKLCGQNAVAHCATCEQPLCKQHALPKKPGVYLCNECSAAAAQFDKNQAGVARQEKAKRDAEVMKSMANPPVFKPKSPPAPTAAGAPQGAPAPAAKEPEKKPDEDAPLEFTPTKKP